MTARREFLNLTAGLVACIVVRPCSGQGQAQGQGQGQGQGKGQGQGSAQALAAATTAPTLDDLIRAYVGSAVLRADRVKFEIASLVENGNSVPVTVRVTSPMTPQDHVVGIAIFNEKNPQHDVAIFQLSAESGIAAVTTRMRLAASQKLVAVI